MNADIGHGIHCESTKALREQAHIMQINHEQVHIMQANHDHQIRASTHYNKRLRGDANTREGRVFREVCHIFEEQIALEKEIE